MSGLWLIGTPALAYRSLIAGEQGRLDDQRLLAEQAMELALEYGVEEVAGEVPLALGISLAARGRPGEALPLIDRGVAALRSPGPAHRPGEGTAAPGAGAACPG